MKKSTWKKFFTRNKSKNRQTTCGICAGAPLATVIPPAHEMTKLCDRHRVEVNQTRTDDPKINNILKKTEPKKAARSEPPQSAENETEANDSAVAADEGEEEFMTEEVEEPIEPADGQLEDAQLKKKISFNSLSPTQVFEIPSKEEIRHAESLVAAEELADLDVAYEHRRQKKKQQREKAIAEANQAWFGTPRPDKLKSGGSADDDDEWEEEEEDPEMIEEGDEAEDDHDGGRTAEDDGHGGQSQAHDLSPAMAVANPNLSEPTPLSPHTNETQSVLEPKALPSPLQSIQRMNGLAQPAAESDLTHDTQEAQNFSPQQPSEIAQNTLEPSPITFPHSDTTQKQHELTPFSSPQLVIAENTNEPTPLESANQSTDIADEPDVSLEETETAIEQVDITDRSSASGSGAKDQNEADGIEIVSVNEDAKTETEPAENAGTFPPQLESSPQAPNETDRPISSTHDQSGIPSAVMTSPSSSEQIPQTDHHSTARMVFGTVATDFTNQPLFFAPNFTAQRMGPHVGNLTGQEHMTGEENQFPQFSIYEVMRNFMQAAQTSDETLGRVIEVTDSEQPGQNNQQQQPQEQQQQSQDQQQSQAAIAESGQAPPSLEVEEEFEQNVRNNVSEDQKELKKD